jgi:hypothetical protein
VKSLSASPEELQLNFLTGWHEIDKDGRATSHTKSFLERVQDILKEEPATRIEDLPIWRDPRKPGTSFLTVPKEPATSALHPPASGARAAVSPETIPAKRIEDLPIWRDSNASRPSAESVGRASASSEHVTHLENREGNTEIRLSETIRDRYLSYQDAMPDAGDRAQLLEEARKMPQALLYARGILTLLEKHGLAEVKGLARIMVEEMKSELSRLGVPVSPFGESISWAMWDIGKQEHFVLHPEENKSPYTVGSVFASSKKYIEVVNRHIGWEVYRAFKLKTVDFAEVFSRITPENVAEVNELLLKPAKNNVGTLPSYDLARLGALVRERPQAEGGDAPSDGGGKGGGPDAGGGSGGQETVVFDKGAGGETHEENAEQAVLETLRALIREHPDKMAETVRAFADVGKPVGGEPKERAMSSSGASSQGEAIPKGIETAATRLAPEEVGNGVWTQEKIERLTFDDLRHLSDEDFRYVVWEGSPSYWGMALNKFVHNTEDIRMYAEKVGAIYASEPSAKRYFEREYVGKDPAQYEVTNARESVVSETKRLLKKRLNAPPVPEANVESDTSVADRTFAGREVQFPRGSGLGDLQRMSSGTPAQAQQEVVSQPRPLSETKVSRTVRGRAFEYEVGKEYAVTDPELSKALGISETVRVDSFLEWSPAPGGPAETFAAVPNPEAGNDDIWIPLRELQGTTREEQTTADVLAEKGLRSPTTESGATTTEAGESIAEKSETGGFTLEQTKGFKIGDSVYAVSSRIGGRTTDTPRTILDFVPEAGGNEPIAICGEPRDDPKNLYYPSVLVKAEDFSAREAQAQKLTPDTLFKLPSETLREILSFPPDYEVAAFLAGRPEEEQSRALELSYFTDALKGKLVKAETKPQEELKKDAEDFLNEAKCLVLRGKVVLPES